MPLFFLILPDLLCLFYQVIDLLISEHLPQAGVVPVFLPQNIVLFHEAVRTFNKILILAWICGVASSM